MSIQDAKGKRVGRPGWYVGSVDGLFGGHGPVESAVLETAAHLQVSFEQLSHSLPEAGRALLQSGLSLVDVGKDLLRNAMGGTMTVLNIAQYAARTVGNAGQCVNDAARVVSQTGKSLAAADPRELETALTAIRKAQAVLPASAYGLGDVEVRVLSLGIQWEALSASVGQAKGRLASATAKLAEVEQLTVSALRAVVAAPREFLVSIQRVLDLNHDSDRQTLLGVPLGRAMLVGIEKHCEGARWLDQGLSTHNLFALSRGIHDECNGLLQFGLRAYETPLGEIAKKRLVEYASGFGFEAQIGALRPGETYRLSLADEPRLRPQFSNKGTMWVTSNEDGTYFLNVNVTPDGIVHRGDDAVVAAMFANNTEFLFSSAADTQRAVAVLEKMTHVRAVPAREDIVFLKAHCQSIELDASSGVNPLRGRQMSNWATTLAAGLEQNRSIKIDLTDGQPVALKACHESWARRPQMNLWLHLPGRDSDDAQSDGRNVWLLLTHQLEISVLMEHHCEVESSTRLEDILANPNRWLAAFEDENNYTTHVSVIACGNGGPLPKLTMQTASLSYVAHFYVNGKPSDVLDIECLQLAMAGNFEGAAQRALARGGAVGGEVHTVEKRTWSGQNVMQVFAGAPSSIRFFSERTKENPQFIGFSYSQDEHRVKLNPESQRLANEASIRKALPKFLRG
jgi:hypothetical protein